MRAVRLGAFGLALLAAVCMSGAPAAAQALADAKTTAVLPPAGYVIGGGDMLSIAFWRDKDMSAEVVVRPDGRISLPLLNDVQAAGYTPEELRLRIIDVAGKYLEEPNVTVVVREIHSQNVFITGSVTRPSTYNLAPGMNVLQLIALAGGLTEYADSKNIVVIRSQGGGQHYMKFNYVDVIKQKNTGQNIALKPGDTVVVP